MKLYITSISLLLFSIVSRAQITKGNWLVGGNANFSSSKNTSEITAKSNQADFQISPVIGYFVLDKFTAGLKPSFTYSSSTITSTTHTTIFGVGPFVRYYFLNPDNIVNIFSEGGYTYGAIGTNGESSSKSNMFSISAGPVVYFNTSVALEFTLGYSTTRFVDYPGSNNTFRFGIGFQFYLEKDKNNY